MHSVITPRQLHQLPVDQVITRPTKQDTQYNYTKFNYQAVLPNRHLGFFCPFELQILVVGFWCIRLFIFSLTWSKTLLLQHLLIQQQDCGPHLQAKISKCTRGIIKQQYVVLYMTDLNHLAELGSCIVHLTFRRIVQWTL